MITPSKVTPFLWYESGAEEAASLYVSLIPNSRIVDVQRQGEATFIVSFELDGVHFTAMNGGPGHPHTEAFSIAWQVVPKRFFELMSAGTPDQSQRVMQAMMGMVKFDVAALEAAFEG